MKTWVIIHLCLSAILLWATPGMITDLHTVEGDSGLYRRNIDTVEVNLNINGTHVWNFSDNAITWPEIDEKTYTKNRSAGMFGYLFPEASLVSQTFSVLDTMESYFNKTNEGIFAVGFTTIVLGQATPSRITQGGPARLMLFPSLLGDTWLDNYVMTSGFVNIYTLNFVEVVDTGRIITNLTTFPCVVVRMYQDIEIKLGGITIKRMHIYRYDWYVDSLTSVVQIQSRDDATNPNFTEAIRVARVKELSYYNNVGIKEKFVKSEDKFFVIPTADGLKMILELSDKTDAQLTLYDLCGRRLAKKTLVPIDLNKKEILWRMNLNSGVYFLKLKTSQTKITKKVVVFN